MKRTQETLKKMGKILIDEYSKQHYNLYLMEVFVMEKPNCNDMGKVVRTWPTGDDECNAYSKEYECGAVYNNNYMDIVGNRDHDCFWNCENCKRERK